MNTSQEIVVLGSGGPFANPTRASSGFVVLDQGRPLALVDAGGGTFERLGRSGIGAAAIDTVLLTHFHIDHSGGLAPIVFTAWMEGRTEPMRLVGPAPMDDQPGARRFAEALFGEDGAWSYMQSREALLPSGASR
jgi:ribonuclease BN (tRNA processing enzyme)